jgi:hypothetical protein
VDETNVQSIDIAPTVLDVLGISTGPRMDGRSLIDENAEIPEVKTITSDSGSTHVFYEKGYTRRRAAAHRDSVEFFTLEDPRSDLFNFGPGLGYLGEAYETLLPQAIPCRISVIGPRGNRTMNLKARKINVMVKGTISLEEELSAEEVVLAISVNGTIKAVTMPYPAKGTLHFHKVLSETYFQHGENSFNLLVLPSVPK